MTKARAFETERCFSELLQSAARGEKIPVVRRGKPAAILIAPGQEGFLSSDEAVCCVREIREGTSHGNPTIRELIDEGRRP